MVLVVIDIIFFFFYLFWLVYFLGVGVDLYVYVRRKRSIPTINILRGEATCTDSLKYCIFASLFQRKCEKVRILNARGVKAYKVKSAIRPLKD